MRFGTRLIALAATTTAVVLLMPSPAEADVKQDPTQTPTVSLVPATSMDMPTGNATFGPEVASTSDSRTAASWVCTVYASDIWKSGEWAEGEGSQFCSGAGYSPIMIRTQIQRDRWWGWETVKTDTSSWTSGYMITLLPGYDCDGDGTFTYRLVTTGWAAGGAYSQNVQSLNYVRFSC